MQPDTVAADLARIGEHWADRDRSSWLTALAAYEKERSLTENEKRLIEEFTTVRADVEVVSTG